MTSTTTLSASPTTTTTRHGAVTAVVCMALAAVVAAMASLNVALPGHRPRHAREPDPAGMGDRRLFTGLRRPVAAGRRDRRPLRAPQSTDRRPADLRHRIGGRDDRRFDHRIDRAPGDVGPGRRTGDAGHPVHHHRHLPEGSANQGGQHLGRCRGRQCGTRVVGFRGAVGVLGLAIGLRAQCGARRHRHRRHAVFRTRIGRRERAKARCGRRPAGGRRTGGPRLLHHRGADRRLAQRQHPGRHRDRNRGAGRIRASSSCVTRRRCSTPASSAIVDSLRAA